MLALFKSILKSNAYLVTLVLIVITFLGYQAMKMDKCVEIDNDSIRIGECISNESIE